MATESEHSPSTRKILYVIDSLDRGGAQQHLALVLPRLAARGWQPIIYCLRRAGVRASEIQANGIRVIGPVLKIRGSILSRIFPLPLICLSALRLLLIMVREKPAIAHFFLPTAYLIGKPAALLARVPVTVMSRRSLNRYSQRRLVVRWLERMLHRYITAVLANSRAIVHELIEKEGCGQEKVGLIYNGVDLSEFLKFPRSTARKDDGEETLQFIIVANLIAYKGHADLLNALAGISDRLPRSWRLQCVGRDDGCRSALEDQARHLGLSDHVTFAGERNDIPELLSQSEIGILCSHEEGFSNAILEAMAAGLPMVVTDVGGNAEAVLHEEIGLVVPSQMPEKLGDAILTLALDGAARRSMGEAARKRVSEKFGIGACVEKYDRVYKALLKGEPVSSVKDVGVTSAAQT